jgi:hypothetical protein
MASLAAVNATLQEPAHQVFLDNGNNHPALASKKLQPLITNLQYSTRHIDQVNAENKVWIKAPNYKSYW